MRNFIIFVVLAILCTKISAQVVTTEPVFPTLNKQVTIYFDATQGAAGLKDCNCDVYVHTGVITSESAGPSDWKHVKTSWGVANSAWKMTKVSGSNNLYSYNIMPSIKEYYETTANETVQKLAFVFRNSNGSKVGKEVGDQDIFIDVFPETGEILYNLITPVSRSMLVEPEDIIPVKLLISEKADITLFKDNTEIASVMDSILTYQIIVDDQGTHNFNITVTTESDTLNIPFSYTVPEPNTIADLPGQYEDGLTMINDSTAILSLFAPGKQHVFLLGDFNSWNFSTDYQMNLTSDGNYWWIELNELMKNKTYAYQYVVDGIIRIADPYSQIVLDPNNDRYIEDYNYPDMASYPDGLTNGFVTVFSTISEGFEWKYDNYNRPEKEKLIIYELMLRDFLLDHSYSSLTDTLDYLADLGINAIELLPVNEFEGNISWGYNPSYHYALDKYYGSPKDFKIFVDAAHQRGIAVILDVVYNHAFDQSPLAQLYWDSSNSRPAADSPWFNPVPKHPYNVGNDFNHESPATKYYVKRGLKYWIEEYHVDGYRFDLSKGFTQKQSSDDSQMAAYDAGRISILEDYADHVWNTSPNAYVILEHFAANTEEKVLSDYGMMLWGNNNYQFNEATMGFPSNISNLTNKQRGWSEPNLVGYMESHDEERLMYKNLTYGNSYSGYSAKNLDTALDRMKLAGAFFLLIPGPKMLWQFSEVGYDFSLFTCSNGTVNNGCKLDPKPIRWDYFKIPNRKNLYDYYSAMTELKKTYDVFNTDDYTASLSGYMKTVNLNDPEINVTIIGNFDVKTGEVNPKFQHTGTWYDYFSGDSIDVSEPTSFLQLHAGEFRIYSDKKLKNSGSVAINDIKKNKSSFVYPNPAYNFINIEVNENVNSNISVLLFDLNGRLVASKENLTQEHDEYTLDLTNINPGFYFLKLSGKDFTEFHKILVIME